MFNDETDNIRSSSETESPEVKARSMLGRAVSYGARRLIDRPSIGRRRRNRRGLDVDIPTGGIPGSRIPTGSRLDPDKDGWAGEGTTNPIWVGVSKLRKISKKKKLRKEITKNKLTERQPTDRLFSGAEKPSWPRKPTYGAFVDGANDYFASAKNWKEFSELYKNREIIWLDYETTGLIFDDFRKPSHNGNPLQLGLVKVKNGKIIDKLNVFMNPEMRLEPWSRNNLKDSDGNPITEEWLSTQMSMADAHKKLVEFAGNDAIFGVQNASFDKDVLEDALENAGISWRPYGYIDTKEISDMVLPKWNEKTQDGPYRIVDGNKIPSNGLADITKYLGVDLGSKHHYATEDARAASEVMQAIIDKAFENNWSTDIFKKEVRDAKLLKDKKKYAEKIEKFKIDKENWLKNNIDSENSRLSSGLDKNNVFKISAEEIEKIEQHRRRKYKYGDESILHDGKPIRRDRPDWLEGLTPEQMAEVLVPSSNKQLFEMWLDDFAPSARLQPQIVEAFRKYWENHMEKNPWDVIDESPEYVQAMRDTLKMALESNPYMRWAYEKHGAPMHAIWSSDGIDLWESTKAMQELLDTITKQRGYKERAHISGRLSPFSELMVFHPKTIIERMGNDGEKIPLSLGQNHEVTPGDSHIDNSVAGRIMHEWSHWLHWRAIRDQGKIGETKNRIYYGSGDMNDPQYVNAMSIAEQYRSHSMNPNLIKLHEDGVDINRDPTAPRTTTSYSHISPSEMIAEGISAILHPNRDIQNNALNDKLRKDAKILLGGDGIEDEPWESHLSKEIAIRRKKINSLTKQERKSRLESGKLDALGREDYKNSFVEKYSPKPNFKQYVSGTSPNNLIFSRETAKDKFDISTSNLAKLSYVDEFGRTFEIFNRENPNKFAFEFFAAKNVADSLDFEPYDFFELFTEKDLPNVKRFEKLKNELEESGKFLVRADRLGGSGDSEFASLSSIDNIVTDSSINNEHAYLNLRPIKTENAGRLWGVEAEGIFESSAGKEKNYFLKFDAESENGSNILKTVLVNSIFEEWNKSSNSPISKMINAAVSELFEGETQKYKNQRQMDFIRDFANTIYEKTQDYFRGKGITHIGLYRNLDVDENMEKQIKESMLDIDGNQKVFFGIIDGNPLTSWSNNADSTLASTKRSVGKSAMLKSIVKSDDVFSMHLFGMGSSENEEFILKNNKRPSVVRLIEDGETDEISLSKISRALKNYNESSFFSNAETLAKTIKDKDEESFKYLINFLNNDDESLSRLSSGGSSRAKIAIDVAFKKTIKKFKNARYSFRKKDKTQSENEQNTRDEFIVPGNTQYNPEFGTNLSETLKLGGHANREQQKYFDGDEQKSEIVETEIDSSVLGPDSSLGIVYEIVNDASELDTLEDQNGVPAISMQSAAKRAVVNGIVEHLDESADEVSSLLINRKDVIDLFPEQFKDKLKRLFKIMEEETEFYESPMNSTLKFIGDESPETIFGVETDDAGSPDTSPTALLKQLIAITKPGAEQNLPDSDYLFRVDPTNGQVVDRNTARIYEALKNVLIVRKKLIDGLASIVGPDESVDRTKIISLFPELKEGINVWNQIKDDLTNASGWRNHQFSRADIGQMLFERLIDDAFTISAPKNQQRVGTAFLPEYQRERLASILRNVAGLTDEEMSILGYGQAKFGEPNAEFDALVHLVFESVRSARTKEKSEAAVGFGEYSIEYSTLDSNEKPKPFKTIFELDKLDDSQDSEYLPAPDIKDIDLIIAAEQDATRDFGGDVLMPRGSVRNEPNKYTGKVNAIDAQTNKSIIFRRRIDLIEDVLKPVFGANSTQPEDVKIDVYESISGKLHYFFRKATDPIRPPNTPAAEALKDKAYPRGLLKTVDLRLSGLDMYSAATAIDRFFTGEHLRERVNFINEKLKSARESYQSISALGEISDNGQIFYREASITTPDLAPQTSLASGLVNARYALHAAGLHEQYDARTDDGQKALKRAIISKLIGSWAGSSNKVLLSTLSQELARDIFAINGAASLDEMLTTRSAPKGTVLGVIREVYENGEALKIPENVKSVLESVLKAMHENTQQYFREKGISHITVYRGMSLPNRSGEISKEMMSGKSDSEIVSVSMRPLSSWSTSFDLASRFGGDVFEGSDSESGRTSVVLGSVVPVEDILAIPLTGFGCLMEHEVVLLGRPRESVINKNTPNLRNENKFEFFEKIDSHFVKPLREKEFKLMPDEERLSSGSELMNSKLQKNINDKEILDMSKNMLIEFENSERNNIFDSSENQYRFGLGVDSEIEEGIVIPRNEKGLQLANIDLFDENGEPTENLIDYFLSWTILNGENEFMYGKTEDSNAALNAVITNDNIYFDVVDVYPETNKFIDKAKFLAFEERQKNAIILSKLKKANNEPNQSRDFFVSSGIDGAKNIKQSTIRQFNENRNKFIQNLNTTGSPKLRQIGNPRRIELQKHKNVRRVRFEKNPNNFEDYFIFDSSDGLSVSVFSGEQLKKYVNDSILDRPSVNQLSQMVRKEKPIAKLKIDENKNDFLSMFNFSVDESHRNRGIEDAMVRVQHEFNASDVSKYLERLSSGPNKNPQKERKTVTLNRQSGTKLIPTTYKIYDSESDWINEKYPRPNKEQIQQIKDAGKRIIKSRLDAVWFSFTQPNGEKIKSPLLTHSGRLLMIVNVNGIRVPFYRSSGKNKKEGVVAKQWYPFFGINTRGIWFNKFDGMGNYYNIPELEQVAKILDKTIGDDLPDAELVRWNASDRKETPKLRKNPKGAGYIETDDYTIRPGMKRAIAEEMNRDLPEPFTTAYVSDREGAERVKILSNLISDGRETSKKGFLLDEERLSSGGDKKNKGPKFKKVPNNDKRVREFAERYGTEEKVGKLYFEEPDENLWDRYKKTLSDFPNLIKTELTNPEKPLSPENWNPGVAFAREMFNKAKFVEYTNAKGKKYLIALVMDTAQNRVVAIDVNELKKDMRKFKSRFTSWDKVLDTYTNRNNPFHSSSRHINALVGWVDYRYQGKFRSREVISGSEYGDKYYEIPEKWVVADAKVKAWHQGQGITKELVKFHREVFPELNLGYKFKTEKEKNKYYEMFDWWEGKDNEGVAQRKKNIRRRAESLGTGITQEDVETRLRSGGDSLETKQKRFRKSEKLAQARKLLQSLFNDTPVKGLIQTENKRQEKMKEMLARGLQKIGIPNDFIWRIPGQADEETMDEVLSLLPEEKRIVSTILESGGGIVEAIDDEMLKLFEIAENSIIDEKTGKTNFDLVAARHQKLLEIKNQIAARASQMDILAQNIPGVDNLPEISNEVLLGIALGEKRSKTQSKMKSVPYAIDAKIFVGILRDAIDVVNSSNAERAGRSESNAHISGPSQIDDLSIDGLSIVNQVEKNEYGIHKVELVGKKLKKITRGELGLEEDGDGHIKAYEKRKPTEIVGTLTEEEKNLIEENPSIVSDLLAIIRQSQLVANQLVHDIVNGDMDVDEKTGKQIPLLQLSDERILGSFTQYDMFYLMPTMIGGSERDTGREKMYDFLTEDEKRNFRELEEKIAAEKLLIAKGLPRTMSEEEYQSLVAAREQMLSSRAMVKFRPYLGEVEIDLPLGNGNGYSVGIKDFGNDIFIRKSGNWGAERVSLIDMPDKYQNFVKKMNRNLKAFLAISGEDRKKIFVSQVRKFFESEQVQSIERAMLSNNTAKDIILKDGSIIPAGTTIGEMRERARAAARKVNSWEKELVQLVIDHNEKATWGEEIIGTLQDLRPLQNSLSAKEINQKWRDADNRQLKSWVKTRLLRLRQQKTIEALEAVGVVFTDPDEIDKEFYDVAHFIKDKSSVVGVAAKAQRLWEIKHSQTAEIRQKTQLSSELLYPLLDSQDRILRMIPKSLTDGSLSEQLSSMPDFIYSPYVAGPRKKPGEKRGVLKLVSFLNFGRDSHNHRANHSHFYDENGNITSIISSADIPTLFGRFKELYRRDDSDIQNWERIQLHETIHGVEAVNPWLGILQHMFWLSRRKKGEKLQKLNDIAGQKGYDDQEVAIKDDWKYEYAGKKYSGPDLYERSEMWEILTTGMERLFFGNRNLEVEEEIDRDHLNFVLGVLALSAMKPGDSPFPIRQTERLSSGSDEKRALIGKLLKERDTTSLSASKKSIMRDYAEYRYEMSPEMANSIVRILRSLPMKKDDRLSSGGTKKTFFHGTAAKLKVGDELLPPSETGIEPVSHPDITPNEFNNRQYVYLSSHISDADNFAGDAVSLGRGKRKYVYEVEPIGDAEEDPESMDNFGLTYTYRAPRARVVRIVGIDEIERDQRLVQTMGPDRGELLSQDEYEKIIVKWLKQEEKLTTPKFRGPPTKKNVSEFLKKYYIDASDIVQSDVARVEFNLSTNNDEEKEQLQDNLDIIKEWARRRELSVDTSAKSPTTTRVSIYDRLSSGGENEIELLEIEPKRTIQEKLDQGPRYLQFGRSSNGAPQVATIQELKKVYGKHLSDNTKYFNNKYNKYNLKFNFRRPPVKGDAIDMHIYYGQLQALDDALSMFDESGVGAMLTGTEFIINQEGYTIGGRSVGAAGTFAPGGEGVGLHGATYRIPPKMWLSWGLNRIATEGMLSDMKTEINVGKTLEQIIKNANIIQDASGMSAIATLGYPQGPKGKEDFARRFAYGITIHEFGHMLDFFARKSLQAGPESLRQSTTRPSRTQGPITGANGGEQMHSFVYSTLDANFEQIPSITKYGSENIVERTAEAFSAWWLFSGTPVGTLKINPIDVLGRKRQTDEDISVIAKMILKPLFDSLGDVVKSDSANNDNSLAFAIDKDNIPPLVKLFAIWPYLKFKKERQNDN